MRYKTIDVEPFNFTYRVFNKGDREYYGDFTRLIEAIDFIEARFQRVRYDQPAISYTLKTEREFKYETRTRYCWEEATTWRRARYEYHTAPASPWVIVAEGEVVPEKAVAAEKQANSVPWRNHGWSERDARYKLKGVRMARKKGSGDKVKLSCEQVPSTWDRDGFTNRIRGNYRGVKTANEQRWNMAHEIEYGPGIVRRARSKRNLPNSWDDVSCSAWRTEDNWKHHSKRRKQWKPK